MFNIKQLFSVSNLIKQKKQLDYKLCYKKKYKFLALKSTPSIAFANHFLKRGNFLKIYKNLGHSFYRDFLINNNPSKSSQSIQNKFFYIYSYRKSFRNLNNVLFWKFKQLNCMFAIKKKTIKKKKQKKTTRNKFKFFDYSLSVLYITKMKRYLLCMNLVKYLVLLDCKKKQKNITNFFFKALYDYLLNEKHNLVLEVRDQIYHQVLVSKFNT